MNALIVYLLALLHIHVPGQIEPKGNAPQHGVPTVQTARSDGWGSGSSWTGVAEASEISNGF